jgi:hypothetical protein
VNNNNNETESSRADGTLKLYRKVDRNNGFLLLSYYLLRNSHLSRSRSSNETNRNISVVRHLPRYFCCADLHKLEQIVSGVHLNFRSKLALKSRL